MMFSLEKVFSAIRSPVKEQPKRVVGIDLGSSSVKVVEIELRGSILTLTTYGELQLGPYMGKDMGSVVELPLEKRIEAVVDVMRESGVTAKNGVLALPLSESFVTVISMEAEPKEDITPRVNVESRKYIPVPIAEVSLEWTEINRTDANTREVLLAAIRNDALDNMKSILEATQMISNPSEIELFSTLRAVAHQDDVSIGVIDVGAEVSKLYIAEHGLLQRIHRARFGGSSVTDMLSKQLGVSFQEAENIKRNYSPEQPHAELVKKAMSLTFERPLQEFKRVIAQYEQKSGAQLSRLVLSGGSAGFADFQSYCNYLFDREVELANPFTKVAYPAFMEDTIKEIAPTFTVALGAALRSFEA